jgi:hypothetical protein
MGFEVLSLLEDSHISHLENFCNIYTMKYGLNARDTHIIDM